MTRVLFSGLDFSKEPIRRWAFILTVIILLFWGNLGLAGPEIRIATAGEGTLYYIFGDELASFLNDRLDGQFSLTVISTAGSQDNIERLLLDPKTMLALSQEDVAHFYYMGQDNDFFFVPRKDDFRITSIGRPFSEVLYCITMAGTKGFQELKKVHVGAAKSGTYVTYTSYRMDQKPTWEETQNGNAYQRLQAGEINGLFEVEANPNPTLTSIEGYKEIFDFLPIRRTDLTLGLDIYQPVNLPDLADTNGGTIESIAIPTVLLCSRGLPREIAEAVLEVFFDEEIQKQFFPKSSPYLQDTTIIERGGSGTFAGDHRFIDLPLPPHPLLVRKSIGSFPYFDFIPPVLALLALWVIWGLIRRWSPTFRARYETRSSTRSHYRDGHFVFAIVILFLATVLGVKAFEIQELISGRAVAGSGFITMTFSEIVSWLFIFLVSGYSADLYPVSPIGGFLPIGFKVLGGLFFTYVGIRVLAYIVSMILERRGTMLFKDLEGHVIICNWDQHAFRLVELLKAPDVPIRKAQRRIVIITKDNISEAEKENLDCLFIEIDPWEKTGLIRARAEFADSIIIVPPAGDLMPNDSDGVVLRTALAVKNHIDLAVPTKKNWPPPSIVAGLNLQLNRFYLEDMGIDEIVVSRDIGMRMLAQAVICPGASFFFNEILDMAPESNEIYATCLPAALVGKVADFRLVLDHFSPTTMGNEPVVPIAIRLKRPVDADLKLWGNKSHIVLVNPTTSNFDQLGHSAFVAEDEILVLADNPLD